jgi:hypothetical protein
MIIGPTVIGIGFFMYMVPGVEANYWSTFLPATVVFGIGLGITVAPLTAVALGAVPTPLSGLASGVSNAASRVATMLAVAMLGALMVLQFSASLKFHTKDLPLSEENHKFLEDEALNLGEAQAPPYLSPEFTAGIEAIIDEAFVDAFRVMMGLCGVLALASAAISAKTISNQIAHYHESEMIPWLEPEPAISDGPRPDHDGVEAQMPGVNGHSHFAEWYESSDPDP